MFYEYFIGQGMFFKLNKIPLIWARLQECYFKMLTLLHKIHEVNKKKTWLYSETAVAKHIQGQQLLSDRGFIHRASSVHTG